MASKTKNDVFGRLFAHRDELKRFGVKKCGLFGSYIRNQQSRRSDIDILVEFEPEYKTFDNFMNLAFYLEKLLGCDVDLVTIESLSPYIGPRILEEVEYVSIDA